MPKMRILSRIEQDSFNKPPIFDKAERKKFFAFSSNLLDRARRLRMPEHRIYFLLTCGYFRAVKKFFLPHDYHQYDISYVAECLGEPAEYFVANAIPETSRRRYRHQILAYYGFRQFDQNSGKNLKHEILHMVHTYLKPKLIFWRCLDFLNKNRIQTPDYNELATLILSALKQRRDEIAVIINKNLDPESRDLLDSLFQQNSHSRYARYKLTLLKNLSQATKPTKIKERTDDLFYMSELYNKLATILPVLNLGHEGIRYFAHSVIKADIFQLNQRSDEDRYTHVIAFIIYQYYKLQDNLIDTLINTVNSYQNGAKRKHKDWCYEQRKNTFGGLKEITASLDKNVFGVLYKIQEITQDNEADAISKLSRIDNLLSAHQDNILIVERQLQTLTQDSKNETSEDHYYYEILEKRSLRLQNRVSLIIRVLDFDKKSSSASIVKAISYFKDKNGVISKNAPINFLALAEHTAVIHDGGFRSSLYKVFLFIHIAHAIKSGQLNFQHSYKYRPLDDYLITKQRWNDEKKEYLNRAGLSEYNDPNPILDKLDKALYQQYKQTNQHINNGQNSYLKIRSGKKFTIATPKQEDQEAEILRPYFPERHFVPLPEILSTVNSHTNFLEEFQHWQQLFTKSRPADRIFYAGIIGLGCAIGIPKMGRISPQINEASLQHAINWYFSLDNIRSANNKMVAFMNQMELPNLYRRKQNRLHTASDGQKFEVRTYSLNANYSFKYFGKGQGISVNTFIDERHLLWHSLVLSAAERESAYVIDGLMYNDVIKSDIHSTDTHGYSEAIFAITHLLGFSYAPRIKNLKNQVLYIFRSYPKANHPDWAITSDKYINRNIIEECWDDILRLIATIKLKQTTASDIFRRLNSYSKQHRLYQGLKAFGQIIKSDFILRYINDVELRQAIEKQLSKIELANRFTRAVAVGNAREFTQGDKEEQEIAEACNRLIKNTIICWNYLYLSQKLTRMKELEQKEKLISAISNHSIICWEHMNLLGEYDFSDEKLKDSVGITIITQ